MEEATGPVRWEYPPTKRGGRKAIVAAGCYMLEHEATGRFFAGESETVSKEVDKQLNQILMGKHPCKLLNELYSRDSIIKVHEFPVDDVKQRSALLLDLKCQVGKAPYLCLNRIIPRKRKAKSPKDKP